MSREGRFHQAIEDVRIRPPRLGKVDDVKKSNSVVLRLIDFIANVNTRLVRLMGEQR